MVQMEAAVVRTQNFSGYALKPVVRDPERPTKPPSSWLLFLKDFRLQQKGKGEIPAKQVLTVASTQWKALDEQSKKKYEEPYQKEKAIYDQKLKNYVETGKKDAWNRDPERPKRPLTGFLRFTQDFRKSNPDLKLTETAKLSAQAWKDMTAAAKAPYDKAFAAEKVEYARKMKLYQESGKEEAWKEKVGITAQKQKLEAKKEAAAEKKKKAKLAEKTKALRLQEQLKKRKQAIKVAATKLKVEQKTQVMKKKLLLKKQLLLVKKIEAKLAAGKNVRKAPTRAASAAKRTKKVVAVKSAKSQTLKAKQAAKPKTSAVQKLKKSKA